MDSLIIVISILFLGLELYLFYYLYKKTKKHHKLSIKDTAIYPVIVVATIIILLFGQFYYNNNDALGSITSSFKDAVGIVALSINVDICRKLISLNTVASMFLLSSYIGIYVISCFALISISISLIIISLSNIIRKGKMLFEKCDEIDYILGFNDDSKEYLKNYYNEYINKRNKTSHKAYFVIDNSKLDKHDNIKFFLNNYKIPFIAKVYGNKEQINKTINELIKSKKNIKIITFFDEDKMNFDFINISINNLKENVEYISITNVEQERFLNNILSSKNSDKALANGKIRIINKYDLISHEFIKHHNFAKYLDSNLINPDLTINDADINIYVLGFGKVNQAVLRDVLICNQFVEKNDVLTSKRMNVKIYDSKSKIECFELINGLFKYDKKSYKDKDNYLDLPDDYISHIDIKNNTSIFADDFVKTLFDEINDNCKKRNQINYFLISIDSDLKNSDIAYKLRNNMNHINVNGHKAYNTYFIRMKDKSYDVASGIYSFGSNQDVLTYNNVIGNQILKLAKKYHDQYSIYTNDSKPWENLSSIKRKSNMYSVYSLFFKMAMLKALDNNDINNIDDLKRLINDKYKCDKKANRIEDFKSIVDLKNIDFLKFYEVKKNEKNNYEIRDVLAYIEKEKWNAFELAQGVLPMTKSYCFDQTIKNETITTRSKDELYHLAITSSLGIREYYYYVSNLKHIYNQNHEEKITDGYSDVIVYDYDNMDLIFYDINKDIQMKELYKEIIKYLK